MLKSCFPYPLFEPELGHSIYINHAGVSPLRPRISFVPLALAVRVKGISASTRRCLSPRHFLPLSPIVLHSACYIRYYSPHTYSVRIVRGSNASHFPLPNRSSPSSWTFICDSHQESEGPLACLSFSLSASRSLSIYSHMNTGFIP